MPFKQEVTLPSGATVTLSGSLTMKEFRNWGKAEKDDDFAIRYPYVTKLVEGWSLPLDPKDPESLDELPVSDFMALYKAVGEYVKDEVRGKD